MTINSAKHELHYALSGLLRGMSHMANLHERAMSLTSFSIELIMMES